MVASRPLTRVALNAARSSRSAHGCEDARRDEPSGSASRRGARASSRRRFENASRSVVRAPDAVARVAMAAPSACASARDALVAGARPRPGGTPARVPRRRRAPPASSPPHAPRLSAASAPPQRARARGRVPTARVTLRRRRPRDPPRGSPPRPRAPRAPSRRARGGAMRPTRRRRGRRRGRLLRGRRPRESGTTRRHLVQPPRALALRTNPRARDQIQTPGREQTPFLLLSLRGGQPHPSLAARPPAARLGSAPRPIRDGDGSPRRIPKPKSARTADRERHRRRYHQRRGRDGARGGGYASRRTGDTIRGGEEGVRDGKGGVRRGVGGARRGRQRPTTREGRFARRGRGTSRGVEVGRGRGG